MNIIEQIATWILQNQINDYLNQISTLTGNNNTLKDQVDKLTYPNPKQKYYETKYPSVNITYAKTDILGTFQIDVRQFIQPYNFMFPTFQGSDDEIALQSLIWIINNIIYTTDMTEYKQVEYWAQPYEVLNWKHGDCEDGALLLASILIKNEVPSWKLRVSAGWVVNPYTQVREGHSYVTYYCEETDKWVTLDWCYVPNQKPINERIDYKEDTIYQDVWFSFNDKNAYSKDEDIRNLPKFTLNH